MSIVRERFPNIDEEIYSYVEGVLKSTEDFETSDDIYDAIGAILVGVLGEDYDNKIRELCDEFFGQMCVVNGTKKKKTLDAPVQMSKKVAELDEKEEVIQSVWLVGREDVTKVDQKKLEKAEAKLREKAMKRYYERRDTARPIVVNMATASQVVSRKEKVKDEKGSNNSKDIRIENFDVAFGNRILIENTTITLSFGRRYALIGRNGLGKTTLLRMISSRNLHFPAHISVLHVEQEVVGDETRAIDSVLEADTVRSSLLSREKECQIKTNEGNQDSDWSSELTEIYAHLQAIEADKAPARASVILAGLGFNPEMQVRRTAEFSGGWRMRIALARALFTKPDLLLLDEPTNMLDMKAIIWLENYLLTWSTTLLVVSHDRNFLDFVPSDILHLHSQTIDSYRGNYTDFITTRGEKLKNQQREYDSQEYDKQHAQEFIDKFRYNAKRATLVQSRIKMIEKMPVLKPVEKEPVINFTFPFVEKMSPPILQLSEINFHYKESNPIFKNVDISAEMESRICIVGDNGAGKTTLLKLLLGELNPTKGHRFCHRSLRLAYFTQHHIDQLDMSVCPVELLQAQYPGKTVEQYRKQLGSFDISGDLALKQLISLSGGQKSRVAFALMCMGNPNFFILDEPTNHLDIETIEALGNAINNFKGGVVLVSHDERLIRMVCTELWVCGNYTVKCIEGGFTEYHQIVEREIKSL